MTLSAVLLAGGESRRMGADKPQLIFEDEPLWQRQIRLLRRLEPEEIFISARSDPDWRPYDVEPVLDKAPSRGPMSGICAALSRMNTSHLLVLAVDMPFVLSGDLQNLVSHARESCGVVPVANNRLEPLAAIYSRESTQNFETFLSSDNRSVHRVAYQLAKAGMLDFLSLSREERERYRSLNTSADLVVGVASW